MAEPKASHLFEVSWEVCNKVGGIYTVVKSKVPQMMDYYRNYFLIGPYFKEKALLEFEEKKIPEEFSGAASALANEGLKVHFGEWVMKGSPKVFLIEFEAYQKKRNELKRMLWDSFRIDSLNSPEDFDEPAMWGIAAGRLLEEIGKNRKGCVAHFHEWLAGFGLIYLRSRQAKVATVFTTHATMLGRAIAGSGIDLVMGDNGEFNWGATTGLLESFMSTDPALGADDVILVGDSLGQVVLGHSSTLNVTMEDMVRHTEAAARGRKRAFLIADMPFLSYQTCAADAIRNAGRLLQAGAEAVKLEGGRNAAETIRAIASADIPVMGHIGLTPQSVHRMGGYRVQGKTDLQRERLLDDAAAVQEAGAFSVVLEGMPAALAEEITRTLSIPTIGIGAGVGCDGQVLVMHDLLGLFDEFRPKFVKRFGELRKPVEDAVGAYAAAVRDGSFPGKEHSF